MAYDYDKLYKSTPNALGDPAQVFVDFFAALERRGLLVLDIGCGQGRDAIPIARLGHSVIGVDLSASGIADLTAAALAENLSVTGIAADITTYEPPDAFDILLIDRTLHMLHPRARHDTLRRLIGPVRAHGWALISDEPKNLPGLEEVFAADPSDWTVTRPAKGVIFLHKAAPNP